MGKNWREIFEDIVAMGYPGTDSRLRSALVNIHKKAKQKKLLKKETKPEIIRRFQLQTILCKKEEKLSDGQKIKLKKITTTYPELMSLHRIVQDFRSIFDEKRADDLEPWAINVSTSGISKIKEFAKGLQQDMSSVKNSLLYDISNGLLEGHVNRLKVIKRQMYGRANFDLLRQKVLFNL